MEPETQIQDLINKLNSYRTICEDLFTENKELKEKVKEYENNTYSI